MTETPKRIPVLASLQEMAVVVANSGVTADELRDVFWQGIMARQAVQAQPIPRRWHRCKMVFADGDFSKPADRVEWCACGGIRRNGGRWMGRNTRRKP